MPRLMMRAVWAVAFGTVALVLALFSIKFLEQILSPRMVNDFTNSVFAKGSMMGLAAAVIFCSSIGWNWSERSSPLKSSENENNRNGNRTRVRLLVLGLGAAMAFLAFFSVLPVISSHNKNSAPLVYQRINGAFGKELGSTVTLPGGDRNERFIIYPFSPVSPSPYFREYTMQITPLSGQIVEVSAKQLFEESEDCDLAYKDVEAILDSKYGEIKSKAREQNGRATSYSEGRREIQLFCLSGPIFTKPILHLRYIDWDLNDKVMKESMVSIILEERQKRDEALASDTDGF